MTNQPLALFIAASCAGIFLLQHFLDSWLDSLFKGSKKKSRELNPKTFLDPDELGELPQELVPGLDYSRKEPATPSGHREGI